MRKMGKKTISVNNSSVAFIMTLNIPSSKHLGYAEGLHWINKSEIDVKSYN